MQNRWNDADEQSYVSRHGGKYHRDTGTEKEILRQAYATTLLGADKELAMHGGGNTSIKVNIIDEAGRERRALYVKATGTPLDAFTPDCFVVMDLEFLEGLKGGGGFDDAAMAREFGEHRLTPSGRLPSIESLMHAFIPAKVVGHSHPEALLKLANRVGGAELLADCFGDELAVIPYARMGYDLASAVSGAVRNTERGGVVIVHHGLVVWGGGAREVYDSAIDIVNRAEKFLASVASRRLSLGEEVSTGESAENYLKVAPLIREALLLALRGNVDNGDRGVNGVAPVVDEISLILLNTPDVLELINSPDARIVREPPLTPDYPMSRRFLPLWLDVDISINAGGLLSRVSAAVDKYVNDYRDYLKEHGVTNQPPVDLLPKAVVHPKTGVICVGVDEPSAKAAADYIRQAFSIRRAVFETGGAYRSLSEEYLFDMQYRGYQHKLY